MEQAHVRKMWLNINTTCNLRCKWCYMRSSPERSERMSLSLAGDIIRFGQQIGIKKYVLVGGEPTVHPDLPAIIRQISQAGGEAALLTNGIRLQDEDYVAKLVQAGLHSVNISLKTTDEDSMKAFTGYPSLDYLEKALSNLNKYGVTYCVSFVISQYTAGELLETVKYIKKIGARALLLSFCQPVISSEPPYVLETETAAQTRQNLQSFARVYDQIDEIMEGCISGCGFLPLCLYPKELIGKLISRHQLDTGCIILSKGGLVFNTEGELCVCNHLSDFTIGKFGVDFWDEPSFRTFWASETVENAFSQLSAPPSAQCGSCELYPYCGGGCPLQWFQYSFDELIQDKE